jgi:hypothetical protein
MSSARHYDDTVSCHVWKARDAPLRRRRANVRDVGDAIRVLYVRHTAKSMGQETGTVVPHDIGTGVTFSGRFQTVTFSTIPAQAGIQSCHGVWTPASAGETTSKHRLAVRSEATRVFGEKSRLALRNHQRPRGPLDKTGCRNNGAGSGVIVGAIVLSFTARKRNIALGRKNVWQD